MNTPPQFKENGYERGYLPKVRGKVGNRRGKPAYRTPSAFRYKKYLKIVKIKGDKYSKNWGDEKTLEY